MSVFGSSIPTIDEPRRDTKTPTRDCIYSIEFTSNRCGASDFVGHPMSNGQIRTSTIPPTVPPLSLTSFSPPKCCLCKALPHTNGAVNTVTICIDVPRAGIRNLAAGRLTRPQRGKLRLIPLSRNLFVVVVAAASAPRSGAHSFDYTYCVPASDRICAEVLAAGRQIPVTDIYSSGFPTYFSRLPFSSPPRRAELKLTIFLTKHQHHLLYVSRSRERVFPYIVATTQPRIQSSIFRRPASEVFRVKSTSAERRFQGCIRNFPPAARAIVDTTDPELEIRDLALSLSVYRGLNCVKLAKSAKPKNFFFAARLTRSFFSSAARRRLPVNLHFSSISAASFQQSEPSRDFKITRGSRYKIFDFVLYPR
ncbi:hypothetical protein R3P38DRAFT_2788988 [Favolaschia claudopus]|uniref:Uncharacterized protein n=1 Tax=Favolaschia claudopus TaxID=2862362 RepID=A0AAW0AJN6_9AGAR